MKANFLFRFIKSLDKGELRYCKKQLIKEETNTTALRVEVFDILSKATVYNKQEVLEKLSKNIGSDRLWVLKTRMYQQLVEYLATLHQQRRSVNDPLKKLEEARVLIEIGMLDDATTVLKKAITQAQKTEDLFTEVTLRELLRECFKNLDRDKNQDTITQNEYQLQTAVLKLGRLIQYTQINDRMWDYSRKHRLSKRANINKAREELISRPEMQDRKLADSLPAQLRYFYVWSLQHSHNGETEKALECQKTIIDLYESNPDYLAKFPLFYQTALTNHIGKLIMAGKTDDCPKLLKKLEKIKPKGRREEILYFQAAEPHFQLYYMNTGQLEKVIKRESKILKGLSSYGKQVREGTRVTLMYNLGVSHLISGKFKNALKVFNKLRNFGILGSRQDLQGLARLFRLVLICDNDTSGGFEHYLRNGQRFFKDGNRSFILENLIYNWLQSHHSIKDDGSKRESFNSLLEQLEPLVADRLVGAEEFFLYARSKVERRPIKEIFLESL